MVSFYIRNNKLYCKIKGIEPNFSEIIETIKDYHGKYDSKGQDWLLPRTLYNDIISMLETITSVNKENEREIYNYLNPPLSIKHYRVPYIRNELKCPPIVGKHPYEDYQFEDIMRGLSTNRLLFGEEQGLGKAYIIVNIISFLKKYYNVKKVVYITSNSGVYSLKNEILTFTDNIPEDNITIGNRFNRTPFEDSSKDIIICNYRSFLLISDEYNKRRKNTSKNYRSTPIPIQKWLNGDKGILILDESHNIAHTSSRQTKVIHLIAPFFEYRYCLSGTPADEEFKYYSQLYFLDPALVKNLPFDEWKEDIAFLGTKYSDYAISEYKPEKLKELSNVVNSVCIRRFAHDCLDLPENRIKKLYVTLPSIQKNIYNSFVTSRLKKVEDNGALQGFKVKPTYLSSLLAIDNPELLREHVKEDENPELYKQLQQFDFKKDHPKIDALLDILADHPKEKIIIWTSHPSVGFYIQNILHKYNPYILNGEIKIPNKMEKDAYKHSIVQEFTHSPDRHILIAGIQVLNTAITAVEANVQIYFDRDFNYTTYNQSIKRIHRIGQKKTVYTYILLIEKTADISRDKALENKDYFNKYFLEKEYFSKEDLRDLFNPTI